MNICIIIYIGILLIYGITRIFIKDIKNRNKFFLDVSFVFLFIILAIREPYSDMNEYLKSFHWINGMSLKSFLNYNIEIFFKCLSYIIGKIWLNDRFYMIILDIITCVGPYMFIKRYSKNYLLSLLLFISIGTLYN